MIFSVSSPLRLSASAAACAIFSCVRPRPDIKLASWSPESISGAFCPVFSSSRQGARMDAYLALQVFQIREGCGIGLCECHGVRKETKAISGPRTGARSRCRSRQRIPESLGFLSVVGIAAGALWLGGVKDEDRYSDRCDQRWIARGRKRERSSGRLNSRRSCCCNARSAFLG
ncbi:hypothetical protein GY45DRAFT_1320917 [Cubamyces sp. BRFM 1775]|nr:hypothetical protein GY45DRAFT_1320917 [Cubamyces sp. BRFM 1775]